MNEQIKGFKLDVMRNEMNHLKWPRCVPSLSDECAKSRPTSDGLWIPDQNGTRWWCSAHTMEKHFNDLHTCQVDMIMAYFEVNPFRMAATTYAHARAVHEKFASLTNEL